MFEQEQGNHAQLYIDLVGKVIAFFKIGFLHFTSTTVHRFSW